MSDEDEDQYTEGQSPLGLGRLGAINEHDVQDTQQRIYGMLQEAKREITGRGIHDMPRPQNHPKPLADMDINTLTNAEVAALYTQYVAYASYIGDELAEIECLEDAAKKLLRETLSELKDALFAKGTKGAEATAAAMQNAVYKELDIEHLKLLFMRNIMKRRYKHYVSQAAALSRTVELRKLDFESQRRDGNLTRRPLAQPPKGFGSGNRKPSSG